MDLTNANAFDALAQRTFDGLTKAEPQVSAAGSSSSRFKKEQDKAKASRDALSRTLEESINSVASANVSTKEGIDAAALATGDKARADQSRAQEVADNESFYHELYGIGKNRDVGVAKDAIRQDTLRQDALSQLEEIKGMQSATIFDNPADWLLNQLQLPGMINKYNATADQVGILGSSINERIAQSNANAAAFNKSIPEITAMQAKATADLAVALATERKAKADIDLASKNVDFRNTKLAGDLAILNGEGKLNDIDFRNSSAAYQSKIDNIRISREQDARNVLAYNFQRSFKSEKATEALLQNYATLTGQKNVIPLSSFEKYPPAQQAEIMGMAVSGSFGADPVTALGNFIKSNPGKDMAEGTVALMKTLNTTIGQIELEEGIKNVKDSKSRIEYINTRVAQKLQELISGASKQGPSNPFFEVSPQTLMQSGFLVKDAPLTVALKAYTDKGMQPTTLQILGSIEAVYPNDPTMQGLVASRYYAENIRLRNISYNLGVIGINKSLPTSYGIEIGGTFGFGAYGIDLTKPEEAAKYFLVKKAGVIPDLARALTAGVEISTALTQQLKLEANQVTRNTIGGMDGKLQFMRRTDQ